MIRTARTNLLKPYIETLSNQFKVYDPKTLLEMAYVLHFYAPHYYSNGDSYTPEEASQAKQLLASAGYSRYCKPCTRTKKQMLGQIRCEIDQLNNSDLEVVA